MFRITLKKRLSWLNCVRVVTGLQSANVPALQILGVRYACDIVLDLFSCKEQGAF